MFTVTYTLRKCGVSTSHVSPETFAYWFDALALCNEIRSDPATVSASVVTL